MNKAIKFWDDQIVQGHVGSEIGEITNYLKNKNVTEISYIDIGANVGKYFDLLSQNFKIKKTIMVEASPLLYQYMEEKFKNNLECLIYNYAISDSNGKTYLDVSTLDWYLNKEDFDGINLGVSKISHGGLEVEMISGDDFFNKHVGDFINNVDFIKIDTENRDYNILKTINDIIKNLENKPYIIFEHNYHNDISYDEAKSIYEKFVAECDYDALPFDEVAGSVYLKPKK